jgi:hypothetical protein
MSDNLDGRAPRDLSRINVTEDWEVRWWSTKFAVTDDQLRNAVTRVGPTTAEVERHLKEAAKTSFNSMGED